MRVPTATYRLQFNPDFGFKEAIAVIDYLAGLGVSDVYASPVFKAREKSAHGYDVVDPSRLNPELGADEDFRELADKVRARGMGWLQDIVPNHMAYHWENSMLRNVLALGEKSRYFDFFDVDWNHPGEGLDGRVLAPFLGRTLPECLEEGEIRLVFDRAGFSVAYHDLRFPLGAESCLELLTQSMERLEARPGEGRPHLQRLAGIASGIKRIAKGRARPEEGLEALERELYSLYSESPEIRDSLDETVAAFLPGPGDPGALHRCEGLLSKQFYRLSLWKRAFREINYRRFFSINDLICLRAEREDVFAQTHSLISRLLRQGMITGLRVDHVDGLHDPAEYLGRLRELSGGAYTVVEKILDAGEELPSSWPVEGTTGYDFLNVLNGVFCDGRNEKVLDEIYSKITGFEGRYHDLVAEKKRLILEGEMAGDLDNLARLARELPGLEHGEGGPSSGRVREALAEILARFPVYRTYRARGSLSDEDRASLETALEAARKARPGLARELELVGECLLARGEGPEDERLHFAMRFQQLTGPLMAKGFEDTFLYVYNRLASLSEVGGSPRRLGRPLGEFHRFNEKRAVSRPHSLNATSTHDTKRGEDVRARINVLSEIPGEWGARVERWRNLNAARKKEVRGIRAPDPNQEYLLYQTLVGALPFREAELHGFRERIEEYIVKAAREAKVRTSWFEPDREHEEALASFVHEILEPSGENPFLWDFLEFQGKVAHWGVFNSLAQTLVKITAPGVPDFYQGAELWDLNLVDPDNRRAVDFDLRKRLFEQIAKTPAPEVEGLVQELLSSKEDGRVKLFLIHRALTARNRNPELFQRGRYLALEVVGEHKRRVIAFARVHREGWAVVAAPRFLAGLVGEGALPLGGEVWKDTALTLPEGAPRFWEDAITGRELAAGEAPEAGLLFERFPGALLLATG